MEGMSPSKIEGRMLNVHSTESQMQNILLDYTYRMSDLEKTIADTSRKVQTIESNYATKTDVSQLETKLSDKITTSFRWTLGIVFPLIFSIAGGGLYLFFDFQKETNKRFQQVESNIHSLDNRLTKVEIKIDNIDQRLSKVETKIDNIDDKLDQLLQHQKQTKR